MKIRLFSIVYREQFVGWFESFCVRSLAWPANIAALREHEVSWDIYSPEQDINRVEVIAGTLGFPVNAHKIDIGHTQSVILKNCLVEQIGHCLHDGASMLLAPPDTVFGDGSVKALTVAAQQAYEICVAVPHVRVDAETFKLPEGVVGNAKLVTLAWSHLHQTWKEADGDAAMSNSSTSGVNWRRISTGLYAVTMRIPTIYLARFRNDDLDFFRRGEYGCWDHRWPEELTKRQTQRLLASSDAAFMVELTPKETPVPPTQAKYLPEIDRYWGDLPHQRANRNAVCIFREGT